MIKKFAFAILGTFCILNNYGQSFASDGWIRSEGIQKSFIENKGQFSIPNSQQQVFYGYGTPQQSIFLTNEGITYTFLKQWRQEEKEKQKEKFDNAKEYRKHEENERKLKFKTDVISVRWLNANKDCKPYGAEAFSDYHSYCYYSANGDLKNVNYVQGYKKIVYPNLYDKIDVEFFFHPEDGIKYNLILHPGADLRKVQLEYSGNVKLQKDGSIRTSSKFGDIIEHAPFTYEQSNASLKIKTHYVLRKNTLSFEIENYRNDKTLILDPWVQLPTFGTTTWNCVWECEKDGSGNVYALGGGASQSANSQMQIKKYNSTGTLQWTYNTPYDTSNCWLGTFATDNAGNSYVTRGSVSGMQKVNTSGSLVWNNNGGGGSLGNSDEYWNIAFNCDQTKLIVGGTAGAFALPPLLEAAIFDIDVNNGNILATKKVAVGPSSTIPPNVQEVRSITSAPNGKYYYITQDTIGYINQNFTLCPSGSSSSYKINNGIDFGYKCEDYRFDNSGIMAIRADSAFVYVNRGNQIQKRSLQTLGVLATASIAGGGFNNVFLGGNTVSNSGIDIDKCGNIYVGSKNQVIKFNSSLTAVATYTTSYNVYDVHVLSTGDIVVCGSTGNSSTTGARTGYIQVISASSCQPIAFSCCNTGVCVPSAFCQNDPATNLIAASSGGTWTGPGITNASAGTFNPSVAGVGTHTITYTMPCGSESINVTVLSCMALNVCAESNGNITVSGTGPFTWYQQTTTQNCSACLFGCNFPAGCAVNVTSWTSFATGTTINPASGSYPMYVINSNGDSAYIPNFASLPSCTSCALNASTSNQTNVSCNGGNNGSVTANLTGGSGTITYSWSPSGGNAATANNLSAGTYTCTITANSCTTTTTVTITEPSSISTSTTSTSSSCGSNNGSASVTASGGTGGYSYSWLPGGATTSTVANLTAGSYTCTVTDGNLCTQTVSVLVNNTGGPTVSLNNQNDVSCNGGNNGSATVNASGGTGSLLYAWSPSGGSSATATNLSAGTYTCTVTDGSGCTQTQTVTIGQPAAISTTTTSTNSNCGSSSGSASVSASGGTGSYSYSWNPGGQTTSTASNITGGTYTCTITDANLCTHTVSVVVNTNGGPTIALASQSNNSCFGDSNGSATVIASGSGSLTYSWTPSGGTASTANNLSNGTYTCVVTDGSGCTQSQTVTISSPTQITSTLTSTPAGCGLSNGSATVVAGGGNGTYTYLWTPGNQSSSTATNLSAGLYTVSITDQNNCVVTNTVQISNPNPPNVVATANGPFCEGNAINLSASGGLTYSWTGPNGFTSTSQNPSISPATTSQTGTYSVTGTDANGCVNTATVSVSVSASPTVTVSSSTYTVYTGSSITFTSSGANSYVWLPGGNTTAQLTLNPSTEGTYTYCVVGTNTQGCQDSSCVIFTVVKLDCGELYIPTAFSPNGDNANDELCVYGAKCIEVMQLRIYDRWGEIVFETTDPEFCWDGKYKGEPLNTAVFAYFLTATFKSGESIEVKGNISLIK